MKAKQKLESIIESKVRKILNEATKNSDWLNAKRGKTFITADGKSYIFVDYEKRGTGYIYTIGYKGYKFKIPSKDWHNQDTDKMLDRMERDINIE